MKAVATKTATTFILVAVLGCINKKTETNLAVPKSSPKTASYPVKPLDTTIGKADGWDADVQISITKQWEDDTAQYYKAVSNYMGQTVGLLVGVPKKGEGDKGFGHGIALQSIGSESDRLLHVLANLYKQPLDTSIRFKQAMRVDYVNLKAFAKAIARTEGEPTTFNEYKLFFENATGDIYAELYLNINAQEHWLELREKDEEYRATIVQFMQRKSIHD